MIRSAFFLTAVVGVLVFYCLLILDFGIVMYKMLVFLTVLFELFFQGLQPQKGAVKKWQSTRSVCA